MKKLFTCFMAACCFSGCTSASQKSDKVSIPDDLLQDYLNFSDMTDTLLCEDDDTIYSPISAYLALSLLEQGAQGNTKDQLEKLHLPKDTEQIKTLRKLLTVQEKDTRIQTANSIWTQEPLTLKEGYQATAKAAYAADLHTFDADHITQANKDIRDWIAEQIQHCFTPDISITQDIHLLLLHTLYFKDRWQSELDDSQIHDGVFYGTEGKQDASYLYMTQENDWLETDRYHAARLDMQTAVLYLLQPTADHTIEEILEQPILNELQQASFTSASIHYQIPQFKAEATLNMEKTLAALDVTEVFTSNANLQNMSDAPLYVDDITQNTFFQLDKDGVEAAAVTSITAKLTAMREDEVNLILDHPFLYIAAIPDENGTPFPLFIGRCDHPSKP